MFIAHHLGGYDSNLHSFPDISTDTVIDVTKYSKVYVNNNMYVVSGVMWVYSQITSRYIGGLVPYFICNDILEGGTLINDENNKAISCVTMKKNNMYALSGLAYETFDAISTNLPIYHHELKNGNSVYGSKQDTYENIKLYAKSFNDTNDSVYEYHIWVGEKIIHITSVNINNKELFRFRIKKGGILANEYVL